MKKKQKTKKRLNPSRVMIVLVFVLMFSFSICAVLVSDIFNVKYIEVSGNEKVTKSSILNTIGTKKDKNIFMYSKKDIIEGIKKNAYIDTVEVERKLPNKIIVKVVEKKVFVTLKDGDNYCYIDRDGNLLEELKGTNESRNDKIIEIDYSIEDYKTIKFKDQNSKNKFFLLMSVLEKYGMYNETKQVNMQKDSNIDVLTRGNIKILLPNDDNLDYNIHRVSKVVLDLNNKKISRGSVDLTQNKYAVYSPE
jgi:cell division protein FtsQ